MYNWPIWSALFVRIANICMRPSLLKYFSWDGVIWSHFSSDSSRSRSSEVSSLWRCCGGRFCSIPVSLMTCLECWGPVGPRCLRVSIFWLFLPFLFAPMGTYFCLVWCLLIAIDPGAAATVFTAGCRGYAVEFNRHRGCGLFFHQASRPQLHPAGATAATVVSFGLEWSNIKLIYGIFRVEWHDRDV